MADEAVELVTNKPVTLSHSEGTKEINGIAGCKWLRGPNKWEECASPMWVKILGKKLNGQEYQGHYGYDLDPSQDKAYWIGSPTPILPSPIIPTIKYFKIKPILGNFSLFGTTNSFEWKDITSEIVPAKNLAVATTAATAAANATAAYIAKEMQYYRELNPYQIRLREEKEQNIEIFKNKQQSDLRGYIEGLEAEYIKKLDTKKAELKERYKMKGGGRRKSKRTVNRKKKHRCSQKARI
jgi:hypothetical protein